jgi:hypothetical protein
MAKKHGAGKGAAKKTGKQQKGPHAKLVEQVNRDKQRDKQNGKKATPATPPAAPAETKTKRTPAPRAASARPKDTTGLPAWRPARDASTPADAVVPDLADAHSKAGGRRVTLIEQAARKIEAGEWTWTGDDRRVVVLAQSCGVYATAALFGVSEDMVRARIGGKPPRGGGGAPRPRVARSTSTGTSSERKKDTTPLVEDEKQAKPLMLLKEGDRFKTPDSPSEGLRGRYGVLLALSPGRARVRWEGATRSDDDADTGERGGEKNISPFTLVVLLNREVIPAPAAA